MKASRVCYWTACLQSLLLAFHTFFWYALVDEKHRVGTSEVFAQANTVALVLVFIIATMLIIGYICSRLDLTIEKDFR